MPTLQLTGLRQAQASLRSLARKAPALVAPCLTRALAPMRAAVASEAPRSSGALAGSPVVRQAAPRNGVCRSTVLVPLGYAGHVDFGTAGHPADDFAQRAFDETQATVTRAASRGIATALEQAL